MLTVAQLADRVAILEDRIATLEATNPRAQTLKNEQRIKTRKARSIELRSMPAADAVAAVGAMSFEDKRAFLAGTSNETLVAWVGAAGAVDRERLLRSLPWQRRAAVVFEVAPAPALVEVTSLGHVESNPVAVNAEQAKTLAAAGVAVWREGKRAVMAGFSSSQGGATIVEAHAWSARVAADRRLAGLLAGGSVTVRTLGAAEARAYMHRAYVEAYAGREAPDGGPVLPSL